MHLKVQLQVLTAIGLVWIYGDTVLMASGNLQLAECKYSLLGRNRNLHHRAGNNRPRGAVAN